MVPVGPEEAQLPVCLFHTGMCTTLVVGFSLTKDVCIHILLDLNGYVCLYHAQIGEGNHLYSAAGRECKWHNRLFFSFL